MLMKWTENKGQPEKDIVKMFQKMNFICDVICFELSWYPKWNHVTLKKININRPINMHTTHDENYGPVFLCH